MLRFTPLKYPFGSALGRRSAVWVAVVALAAGAFLSIGTASAGDVLDKGIQKYSTGDFAQAVTHFKQVIDAHPDNADAHAWLAKTYFYMDECDKATAAAKKALDIDPCHSFANTVLAELYSPRYQCSVDGGKADETWKHLRKAIECDPTNGNAWTLVWIESMERIDLAMEKKALQGMINSELFTPALLEYTRWVMEPLPKNAILLTNGDQDTYPAVGLQSTQGTRADVAVVNLSLLNLPWYARWIRDHYNVPLPYDDKELDELAPERSDDGWVFISKQIVRGWIDMQKDGTLERPLTVAVTIADPEFYPDSRDHLLLAGTHYRYVTEKAEPSLDMAALKKCVDAVDPKAFTGGCVSERDRRALVRRGGNGILNNVTAAALRYGFALVEADKADEAQEVLTWARNFMKVTHSGEQLEGPIENLEKAVKKAKG